MSDLLYSTLASTAGNLLGGVISAHTAAQASQEEYERQKEFAQNSIQWRKDDAVKAGFHPLYALGAQGASYTPQTAMGDDYGLGAASDALGKGISAMVDRKDLKEQQVFNKEIRSEQLKGLQLDNQKKQLENDKLASLPAGQSTTNSVVVGKNINNKKVKVSDTVADEYMSPYMHTEATSPNHIEPFSFDREKYGAHVFDRRYYVFDGNKEYSDKDRFALNVNQYLDPKYTWYKLEYDPDISDSADARILGTAFNEISLWTPSTYRENLVRDLRRQKILTKDRKLIMLPTALGWRYTIVDKKTNNPVKLTKKKKK